MNDQSNAPTQELEEMEDQRDAVTALLASMQSVNEESIPFAMIERMSAGEPPLTVWREYRELSPEALAEKAGVNVAELRAIEAGADPRLRVAVALAKALDIDAENLIPWPQD